MNCKWILPACFTITFLFIPFKKLFSQVNYSQLINYSGKKIYPDNKFYCVNLSSTRQKIEVPFIGESKALFEYFCIYKLKLRNNNQYSIALSSDNHDKKFIV